MQAAALLAAADAEEHLTLGAELRAVADLFAHRHLDPGYDPEADPSFATRVGYVLGDDAG